MKEPTAELLSRLDFEHVELLRRCGAAADERGERAYLVGGSVRDLVLEREHDDLDIVIEGDGLAVAQAMSRALGGELTRHHAFQTATVTTPGGLRIDIATARSEDYPRPGQLPRVAAGTLAQDLERRDFTINAMAVSLAADWGRFIDPLGGLRDLADRRIRVMHSRSFADDPTRILRALRFALRFGYDIEDDTQGWLQEAVGGGYIDEVSGDRVRKELRLMFGEDPVRGPVRLAREAVLPALHPGLSAHEERLAALVEVMTWYEDLPDKARGDDAGASRWLLVLACCAEGLGQQDRWALVRRLRLSRQERAALLDAGTPWRNAAEVLHAADNELPPSRLVALLRGLSTGALLVEAARPGDQRRGRAIRRYLEKLRWVEPELSGTDLQALGVRQGPDVGTYLERLRAARLDGEVDGIDGERRLVAAWLAAEAR